MRKDLNFPSLLNDCLSPDPTLFVRLFDGANISNSYVMLWPIADWLVLPFFKSHKRLLNVLANATAAASVLSGFDDALWKAFQPWCAAQLVG